MASKKSEDLNCLDDPAGLGLNEESDQFTSPNERINFQNTEPVLQSSSRGNSQNHPSSKLNSGEKSSRNVPLGDPQIFSQNVKHQKSMTQNDLDRQTVSFGHLDYSGRSQWAENQSALSQTRERKGCSCKNSQCLKLYCECFTRGEYCGPNCHCSNCKNNSENEMKRAETISNILERNPDAFRAKITSNQVKNASPAGANKEGSGQKYKAQSQQKTQVQEIKQNIEKSHNSKILKTTNSATDILSENGTQQRHTKGCNCKKSKCLKKYCECFQAGITCNQYCKCVNCKNIEGCDERRCILEHYAQIAAQNQEQQLQSQGSLIHQTGEPVSIEGHGNGNTRYVLNVSPLNGASPIKPINITSHQEECANIFGFDFDVKFCKMPESTLQEIKKRKIGEKPDLQPRISNALGISNFVTQLEKKPAETTTTEKKDNKRNFSQTCFKPLIEELSQGKFKKKNNGDLKTLLEVLKTF